ncbi:MAG: ABC transporter substrate-binding protein [Bacteroidaceae bacterium]|nr:ABC transporter substrate-binding protein [Bacteroidaceae bacterium]
MKRDYLTLLSAALFFSCAHNATRMSPHAADELFQQRDSALLRADDYSDTVEIRYARGLQVRYADDGVHVFISNPDPAVHHSATEEIVVTEPHRRFICTTALQLGNFEVLGLEDCIVGMNSLKNLFSPAMKTRMQEGSTARIGKEGNFDLETIIALQPDYIFVSASKHGGFEALRECGIPLIAHHGYKETDPLGQAEWIKLIGLLTGETRRANAVFADIERKYLTLRDEVAQYVSTKASLPTVFSGRQVRDGWYVVGGKSYMARLFEDAGADYLMADNHDSGGVTLDFEAAYARGIHADYWQIDGTFPGTFTLDALAREDERYATMDAYRQEGHTLYCNFAQVPYRELAGVQPHLLLADFVKAFHPELLPHYTTKYYNPLQ